MKFGYRREVMLCSGKPSWKVFVRRGSLTLPCNPIHTATQMHGADLHVAFFFVAGKRHRIANKVAGSY
jgi:hypothetical protein